jgi:hypothetical protein
MANYQVSNPTDNQLKAYYEVCARKRITPVDTSHLTKASIGRELERVYALPEVASEKQIAMLKDMLQELVNAGIDGVRMPSAKFWENVGADRNKCSEWIQNTQKLRAKHFDKLPANESQIERIAEMYLFPDVEWESYGINIKIYTSTYDAFITEEVMPIKENNEGVKITLPKHVAISGSFYGESTWRTMTHIEFMEELKKKLTHSQASAILDQYSVRFNTWLRARSSDIQKQQIREIEARLANLYTPKEVVAATMDTPFIVKNANGAGVDCETPFELAEEVETDETPTPSVRFREWNPLGYVGMTQEALDMLSREEANTYIRQLRYELQDNRLRSATGAQNLSGDAEEARTAQNQSKAKTQEFNNLNNFLYGLSDIVGNYFECDSATIESLRHEALQIFFNGSSEEKQSDIRGQIIDFMKQAVLSKSIQFTGLMNLADRSELASSFIDELITDKEIAVQILQLQRAQY